MIKILLTADTPAGGNGSDTADKTASTDAAAAASLVREQLIQIFKLPDDASDDDITFAADSAQQFMVTTKARLAEQVAALLESSERFDADRLHQEAVMIAAKADIREELARIASHISQAREMIGKGGPIGRRLDFLAQEFNREVNTCCSKSNDLELTNTGLEMKNVVEQFREQVQNLE